ncbi:MAG: TonB-dependent receptor, partial [Acidobacteriota bacterium]
LSAALFDQNMTDLIRLQPVGDHGVQFQNRNEMTSRGFALQVDSRRNDGVWSYASYSWSRAREMDEAMVNSPLYLVKAGISTPTSAQVYGGLEMQYEAPRLTYAGRRTEAALLTNLNLGWAITGPVALSLTVTNLFDTAYATPGGVEHKQDTIVQDGRSFLVRLKWESR